jgi:hypothetical protein
MGHAHAATQTPEGSFAALLGSRATRSEAAISAEEIQGVRFPWPAAISVS